LLLADRRVAMAPFVAYRSSHSAPFHGNALAGSRLRHAEHVDQVPAEPSRDEQQPYADQREDERRGVRGALDPQDEVDDEERDPREVYHHVSDAELTRALVV